MVGHEILPEFTKDGLLPPGDHPLTFDQLEDSHLVSGGGHSSSWDEEWRLYLVKNLSILVAQLWEVGISEIFIDGSFTENKDHPNDIDGYFECEWERLASGELQTELNLLNQHRVWTWDPDSRRPYRSYPKKQLPMWHVYRVDLYPHYGQLCGIADDRGYELEFPSAFRQSRDDHQPRGIVKIVRQ